MGLYEGIKDAISLAQKVDNIDLIRKLLDLGSDALDMQAKIQTLSEENATLKAYNNLSDDIEYYPDPYITRKSDDKNIRYCAACWADKQKLVVLQRDREKDRYMNCPLCKTYITKVFDDDTQ